MLCRSIGEAKFDEVIPHHLLLFINLLINHVIVFVVIEGRIDEKINNTPGDGGDEVEGIMIFSNIIMLLK
jgi:hypothetical protein